MLSASCVDAMSSMSSEILTRAGGFLECLGRANQLPALTISEDLFISQHMELDQPLLTIYNRHGAVSGEPPHLSSEDRSKYFGYFQNEHGEQWLFVYDRTDGTAILRGGDTGWKKVYTLGDPKNLPRLSESEHAWLLACLKAASFGARSVSAAGEKGTASRNTVASAER